MHLPSISTLHRFNRMFVATAIIGAAFITQPTLSYGAGSETPAAPKKVCKKGFVYNAWKKKCVKKTSNGLRDEDRYQQGWKLAKAGYYEKAIEVLKSVSRTDDPRVLNYLGYSHRKMGDLKTGIKYYRMALAIDPDFVLAREYLGEGYVKAGRLDLAKLELAEIRKRCGVRCKEYTELAAVIKNGVAKTW